MTFKDFFDSVKAKIRGAYSSAVCRGVCLILIFAAVISFSACGNDNAPMKKTYYEYFDTVCVISYYGDGGEEYFSEMADFIEGELDRYHRLFDAYNPYAGMNNLYTVNASAGASPVVVDGELLALLSYGKEVYTLTGGEINIAIGAVTSLWKAAERADGNTDEILPTAEELAAAAEHISIDLICTDEGASSVYISDPLALIDVGALGKGFAAERIAEGLKARGADSFVLDLGGNIRAIGSKPDGSGWITGIENPHSDGSNPFAARVELSDCSCVTSGDYRRYFTVDGKKYHHIIDGDTLYPAEYFSSVTVIASDSALCDALSTALFCMPFTEGLALIEATDGAEAFWISVDGEYFYSSGFSTLD